MDILSLLVALNLTVPHRGILSQKQTLTHDAIDIVCSVGDRIVAAHDGKMKHHYDLFLGNVVTVENDKLSSVYAHLSAVKSSDQVKSGDVVGYCGNTGKWSTGAHLHFEIRETHVLH